MMRPSTTHAVSPVVGVMLMLVVVIIIAAVVSGFAGGLVGTTQKVPNLIMDVKIVNTGYYSTSGFFATVVEISRPIPTQELKIVTSWTITNRTTGGRETGGSTVLPNVNNFNQSICNPGQWGYPTGEVSPFGGGQGVVMVSSSGGTPSAYNNGLVISQYWWGQFTLVPGTTLSAPAQHGTCMNYWWGGDTLTVLKGANAYGAGQLYEYPFSTNPPWIDPVTAVLGPGWNDLRGGDTVNVQVIDIPTNSIIFNKNIQVVEG
jgi:hypothetical protein